MMHVLQKMTASQSLRWTVALSVVLVVAVVFWVKSTGQGDRKPLYWVAPMDDNYRRDEPGLSPMGMDLVPVYADDIAGQDAGPGVVIVPPAVQNQLGVRTETAQRAVLGQFLRSYGRVIFDRTLVSKLSPRVSGWVDMLFVSTEGEAVRRGQALYSLYSPELIKVQERYLSVLSKGLPSSIQEAEDELRALKMDEISIAKLRKERVAQQSVVFHAPKDGVIGMLKVGEDHFVEPGDLILALGTLENVWVELDVFESQASLIKQQQLISFTTPAYPGLVWEGEVDYIYPALDSRTQSLRFRAKVENRRMLLKPNMHVQALISLPEREPQVLVSRQAVIQLGDQDRVVLAMGEGRFKSIAVTLGEANSEQVEVLSGLDEGDYVVTSAHFLIDSESSKTSDFKRMLEHDGGGQAQYLPTWVKASIEEVDLLERKVRLHHEYIDDWKMPSMTMNFKAVDALDLESFKKGDRVRAHVMDGDPLFQVKDIQFMRDESSQ